jgi:hypothetical protein
MWEDECAECDDLDKDLILDFRPGHNHGDEPPLSE